MPSDLLVAAMVVGGSYTVGAGTVAGVIYWAQRNRTFSSALHLGRSEDQLQKKICEIEEVVRKLEKKK